MAYCILCYSASSCNTCTSGYNQSLAVSGNNIVMTCQLLPSGTGSKLSSRGQVAGNGVIFQGVALNLMPTTILASSCSICNSLLTVQVVSTFSSITTAV
jgi:hypothetical protein